MVLQGKYYCYKLRVSSQEGLLPESPGANIKEFLVTILSEANFRMVRNSFQRAKGGLGNSP